MGGMDVDKIQTDQLEVYPWRTFETLSSVNAADTLQLRARCQIRRGADSNPSAISLRRSEGSRWLATS